MMLPSTFFVASLNQPMKCRKNRLQFSKLYYENKIHYLQTGTCESNYEIPEVKADNF